MAKHARLIPPQTVRTDWPWHSVKSVRMSVSSLLSGDRRMEAGTFLASGYGLRLVVERKSEGWRRMGTIARAWQPSRLTGIQVSPEFGTPFLAATQVFDVKPSPRKWLSLERTDDATNRFVDHGTIVLTCSGSVGRATIAGKALSGVLVSHDLLRIEPLVEAAKGWLYAYLRAPSVRSMMAAAQYGHIIKHLEVSHIDSLPFVDVDSATQAGFLEKFNAIVSRRDQALDAVDTAEKLYAEAIDQPHSDGPSSVGFLVRSNVLARGRRRLDGFMHNQRASSADEAIDASEWTTTRLGDLVMSIRVPGRFKHVYGDEGVPYLDSAQIMECAPDIEKRVLSLAGEERDAYTVEQGTLLIPCSGQVHGIIGSVVLATPWHENKVLTNHILRIVPRHDNPIRIGYLQQVLSHPSLGKPRLQRSAFGSSVPELSPLDVADLRVPRLHETREDQIADLMELAARLRAEADLLEEAVAAEAEEIILRFLSEI